MIVINNQIRTLELEDVLKDEGVLIDESNNRTIKALEQFIDTDSLSYGRDDDTVYMSPLQSMIQKLEYKDEKNASILF